MNLEGLKKSMKRQEGQRSVKKYIVLFILLVIPLYRATGQVMRRSRGGDIIFRITSRTMLLFQITLLPEEVPRVSTIREDIRR